ncbi:hypothetical protein HanHA300_Chr09g0327721 [Helianthus annuus]|nr:hypothetical protein HanHA300_Chr09g0327721 [Helianthus annuus]KAJ0543245.1 hypothetical protein HanHA89_Chr09g0348641 [Helianthus annuus]KAJ0708302.1 hypothetical protein HanLR1_Chr09g0327981 [Helianthus annuus]KAJ0712248.1 hypothetical protein HanOQP8_Chr09g0332781 [Helianthus annuus]
MSKQYGVIQAMLLERRHMTWNDFEMPLLSCFWLIRYKMVCEFHVLIFETVTSS